MPYQPHFVSGLRAEAYQVGLTDGFAIRRMVDARIEQAIGILALIWISGQAE